MSVVFIVATHGLTAKPLLETCEMLVGKQEKVHTVEFVPGENADTLVEKYKAIMQKYEAGTEFLFVLDLWGGSPFNAANLVSAQNDKAAIVVGANVPALLSALDAREEEMSLREIVKEAVKGGRTGVRSSYLGKEEFPYTEPKVQAKAAASKSTYNGPSKIGSKVIEPIENKTPFTIALTRIDDRLIHGQVATVWTKVSKVSRILVINDEVAKDKVRSTMLKQSTPADVTAHVLDLAKATRVMNNPEYAGERFMLLFTNPQDIEKLVKEAKWPIKEVNVGGISYKDGKTNLSKAVNVNAEEVKAFKELNKLGVKLSVQQVVNETPVDIMKLIAEKNL